MRPAAPTPSVEDYKPKWDKRDVTAELQSYSGSLNVFHRISMGRISTAVYLTGQIFGPAVLHYEESFRHANFEVYAIRIGGPEGMNVGYLFRSPLAIKIDPYFVVFFRRGLEVVRDIIRSPKPAEKKYVLDDLVFHVHDTAYLITRLENNEVTKMLSA